MSKQFSSSEKSFFNANKKTFMLLLIPFFDEGKYKKTEVTNHFLFNEEDLFIAKEEDFFKWFLKTNPLSYVENIKQKFIVAVMRKHSEIFFEDDLVFSSTRMIRKDSTLTEKLSETFMDSVRKFLMQDNTSIYANYRKPDEKFAMYNTTYLVEHKTHASSEKTYEDLLFLTADVNFYDGQML
jgi:hypothetical protein